jgi:D-alanyl-D-alanine carboxypeptidase
MTDTLYANVTGVDYIGQYTTASDVGTLLKYFYGVQYLANTSANSYSSLSSHFDSSRIYSRNFFYSSYYNSGPSHIDNSVIAGTSTYTTNALHCTTAVKEYKGKLYMCVMLAGNVNGSNYSVNYDEIPNVVKWGGDSFDYISVLNKWTPVAELFVEHGLGFDHATVFCKNNVFFYTYKNVDPKKDIKYEYDLTYETLTAPVEEGKVVGKAMAYYNGKLVASEDLIIVNSIALNESSVAAKKVTTFLSSSKFIIGFIIFVVCFVIYVFSAAAYRGHKQRKRLQETEKQ